MAIIKYSNIVPAYSGIFAYFDDDGFDVKKKSAHEVSYVDKSGNRVVLDGDGFQYKGDEISQGDITSFRLTDKDGHNFMVATKLEPSAADLSHTLLHSSLYRMVQLMFHDDDTWTGAKANDYLFGYDGDDKLFGGKGDDELLGTEGEDRLWGGAGSDYFDIGRKWGKDVAMDFHATGGDGVQDFIGLHVKSYTVRADGDDTIIDLGQGDQLVLKNVDSSELTADNFYFY
jgi:Ca2+-binding RTX toxin-like protein